MAAAETDKDSLAKQNNLTISRAILECNTLTHTHVHIYLYIQNFVINLATLTDNATRTTSKFHKQIGI